MTQAQLLSLIAAILPVALSFAGSSVAGLLRTDGWTKGQNGIISIVFVLTASIASAYVSGSLTGNFSADFATIQTQEAIFLGGALHVFTPYVDFLQSNAGIVRSNRSAQLGAIEKQTTAPQPIIQHDQLQ